MGYCPFESRYNGLYRDIGPGRLAWAQGTRPRHGHSTAMTRPGGLRYGRDNGLRYGRPTREACGSAHAHGLATERVAKQNFVSWLRGDLVSRYSAAMGCDTALSALRYGTQCPATRRRGAATCAAACATQRAVGARVAIQFLYRDRGVRHSAVTWRANARMQAETRPGKGPRHGLADATTRCPTSAVHSAWAHCAHSGSAGWVQGVPLVYPTQF